MQIGALRLVLQACSELDEWLLDADIGRRTGLKLGEVRDCIETLDDQRLVHSARLTDGFKVRITAKGRLFLSQRRRFPDEANGSASHLPEVKVVPKGLPSYDEHDADFFLELLPGPRHPNGLPESIHFWKAWIEETDPDKTFRVGLIYGPSGCGKSSLVKAGLLPRLADHVLKVDIEATSDDTEARLLKKLRKQFLDLPTDLGLAESLSALSKGQAIPTGQKLLIVIDQFEQWLHADAGEENSDLIAALRQCDGEHVQAIVIVRDDFWMATNRLEARIGVVFRRDLNSYGVQLFDKRHAWKVLAAFGRAYGAIGDEPTGDQAGFLEQAVEGLTQDGKVIPVRLALLTEMLRGRHWSTEELKKVGGVEGIGVTFLEETFESQHADPRYRRHRKAVQPVLEVLLPEGMLDFKGYKKGCGELLKASGYDNRAEFDELLQILDKELHIITPTDQEGDDNSSITQGERCYQFIHDYLATAVRQWLAGKQIESYTGRMKRRLCEVTKAWKMSNNSVLLADLFNSIFFIILFKGRLSNDQSSYLRASLLNCLTLGGLARSFFRPVPLVAFGLLLAFGVAFFTISVISMRDAGYYLEKEFRVMVYSKLAQRNPQVGRAFEREEELLKLARSRLPTLVTPQAMSLPTWEDAYKYLEQHREELNDEIDKRKAGSDRPFLD